MRRSAAVVLLVVTVQALIVTFFAWPAIRTAPRDVPVVVAGPAAVADRLASARPGAFEVRTVADAAAADQALRDRKAYAAFIVTAGGMEVHIASAASPTVAQLISQQAQATGPVRIVDVVPVDADDPRGAGLAAAFLPLLLTSLVAGALLWALVAGWAARLAGLVGFAVLAGLVVGVILQYGYGALPGSFLANAGVLALAAGAIAASITGLGAFLGRGGVALGALLVFIVGNPLSAVASAPELLPQPWGAIGQLIPPGAGMTLLRSVAYFDGAGGAGAAWTLIGWAVVGLTLVAVGRKSLGHAPATPTAAPAEPAVPVR
jgi:hypothetical protein